MTDQKEICKGFTRTMKKAVLFPVVLLLIISSAFGYNITFTTGFAPGGGDVAVYQLNAFGNYTHVPEVYLYQDNVWYSYGDYSDKWRLDINGFSYEVPHPDDPIDLPPVPPDPVNPDPDNGNTKEPINFISGNNHFQIKGISIQTPGIPLEFALYYNSIEANVAVLGRGWTHSYMWSLTDESNATVVTTSDARQYTFLKNGSGEYSPSMDNNWKLTAQTNGEHALYLPGNITYLFETNGTLQSIADGWSNTVSLVYSNEMLYSVEHSNGQSLDFSYSNGLLSAVTAATNLSVVFTYDNSLLTNVVYQTGSQNFQESYSYDPSSSLMTQRLDRAGSDYHYSYDSTEGPWIGQSGTVSENVVYVDPDTVGKASGLYLAENQWYAHAVSYPSVDSRQVTYRNNGTDLVHEYDISPYTKRVLEDRFVAVTGRTVFVHDSGLNVQTKTTYDADTNHWTQLYRLYDGLHNVTNEAFGLSATPTHITQTTWDTNWQVQTSITDPEGFKTEYEYTNGTIALSRIWLSTNKTSETFYSYTTNGLLSSITNANGHTTSFTYDSLGYLKSVVPQAGPVITFGYDTLGHLTNSTLPGGRETKTTVNPLGWVERIDYADTLYETFQYDGLGDVTNHVDRLGRYTHYTHAPGGKLTAITRQFGSTNVTVSYDYDQQFNTLNIKDELGRPVESYVLDPLDRPTSVTNVEGQTMSIRYLVGNFVDSITRFDTTVVSNEYTGDGHLKAVSYPDETNRYTYLRNGLFQILENSGGMISNDWNSASRLTSQTCTAGILPASSVLYSYDPVGNVTNTAVSVSLATNNWPLITSYSYDPAERLSTISTVSTNLTFSYAYNADNGLVSSVSNASLRAEYQYDIMDRITSIDWKDSWGATILFFDYQYNAAGMITNRVTVGPMSPLGVTTAYQYDDLDRLTSETRTAGILPASSVEYSYDAVGNRLTKTGPDYSVSYTKGNGNRLQSWTATSTNGFAGFRTVRVEGHSSEPIGTDDRWGQLWVSNSVAVIPEIDGTNFSIDAFTVGLGTQAVVAAIRDQAGNMGYATNEIFLTVVTNGSYACNSAGCLTNISYSGTEYSNSKSLTWNSQYQLTSVSSASSAVEYSYDVLGRRSSRTVAGGGVPGSTNTEFYVYDGNQVVADLNGNGNVIRSYTWGPEVDNLLSMTVYTTSETNTYFAIKDVQNSIYALVDESGSVVESYQYDAWGRTTVYDANGEQLATSAIGNRYCFQGREIDWTTGLYYFRARWYAPVVGRWLSKDSIGINGGFNQYEFCGNNPVNFLDPMGLFRFGKRPIDELPWIPWFSDNPIFGFINIELSHEHGFFEDECGGDVGFHPGGRFHGENPSRYHFPWLGWHYDDNLMREALRRMRDGKYSVWPNNCQAWAARLRYEYWKLKLEQLRGRWGI